MVLLDSFNNLILL
uniref:Uncharacterized protein n=1 Tax=Anguilla anguilla TaxID=7936 RepID=A0A0E9UQH9_ANGAN